MLIYCAIDGTDNNDPTAAPNLCMDIVSSPNHESAHVKRLQTLGFERFKYFPGTTDSITGASSANIIGQAMAWIEGAYGSTRDDTKKLFLGGFSRGGAAAIVIANRLARTGIPVQEMYLFDAVDRSFAMDDSDTASIPSNVTRAYHALRDPRAGSRRTFGNCGLTATGSNLVKKEFFTTHGGVGGWPNGEAMVKPGFGAEDYAYVAALGPVVGPFAARSDPRANNIHEMGAPYPTNTTPAQESRGMRDAWVWMHGNALSTLRSM